MLTAFAPFPATLVKKRGLVTDMAKLSMYHKIIIGFLLVVFLILASFIHVWETTRLELKEHRIKLTESQINFALHNVNNMIEQAWQEQKNIVNNEFLKALSQTFYKDVSYDMIQNLIKLQNTLTNIRVKYDYISDIYVYLPSRNKLVTLRDIPAITYLEYKNTIINDSRGYQYQADGENLVINLYSDLFSHFGKQNDLLPLYHIRFFINLNRLKEQFEKILPPESKYAILCKKESEFLFGNDRCLIDTDFSQVASTGHIYVQEEKNGIVFKTATPNMHFVVKVPNSQIYPAQEQFRNQAVLFALFSTLALAFYMVYAKKTISLSYLKLIEAFRTVQSGNFQHEIAYKKNDEFAFLYNAFNIMISKINSLIEQVYIQKIHIQKAELKQLQYQINPHFLYNTLSIVHRMIEFSDYDGAAEMSRYLSRFYQYITRTGMDLVPLEKEYEHVVNYINIQKIRFLESMDITIDELPERIRGIMVPRLVIQPLVENAFKYGMKDIDGKGRIAISFRLTDEFIIIQIDDNGQSLSEEVLSGLNEKLVQKNHKDAATGILNVHRRIRIHFGPESGVRVSRSELGGLRCAINIKLREGDLDVPDTGC
jgi:two-component system sensor histidine kinase YesM